MPRSVTVRTGGTGIDVRDFHDVVRSLRKANPELHRALRRRLRKAGESVAMHAREIASEHSERIPPTIKVRTSGASVAIIAGGDEVPIAPLFELGNTGGSKSASAARSGRFRHPVFGHREVWVNQDMHRYLAPAALEHAAEVDREIGAALDEVTNLLVFEKSGA